MKTTTLKKTLLAGTAIVAVGIAVPAASPKAADLTLGANGTWASAGGITSANVANATAGDNVDITTGAVTLTVTNDGTANDGSVNKNTFALGNVTDSGAGVGTVKITTGSTNDLAVTINDVVIDGGFTLLGDSADDAKITVGVTNDLDIGGALSMTTTADADGDTLTLNVGGDLTVDGTSTLTSTDGAGGAGGTSVVLDVNGDAVFTGAVAATTAGEGDVLMNFGGDVTFTGGLAIEHGVAADAEGVVIVTFDGANAQTVTGNIDGATGAEGQLVVSNDDGVTFAGTLGATNGLSKLTVSTTGGSSAATFQNTVKATAIVLGDGAGTGTNTVTFDSTDNDFSVTGTVDGTAGDTDNIVVTGGGVVTAASKWGNTAALQSLTIDDDTQLIAASTVYNVTSVTLGSGSELNVTGAATVTGDVNGGGTLDLDNSVTLVGDIGETSSLAAVEIATGKVLTLDAATAAENLTLSADAITLQGAASGITFTPGTKTITVEDAISTAVDGAGVLIVSDGTGTTTFNDDIGASTAFSLASLTLGSGSNNTLNTHGNVFVDTITIDDEDGWNILGGAVTISGAVVAGTASDGNVLVGNGTDATNASFQSAIGGTAIDHFRVLTNSTANIVANLSTKADAAGNVGLLLDTGSTLNVDTTAGAVTISEAVGDQDVNGTLNFSGADSATFSAADDIFIDGTVTSELATTKTLTVTSTGDDTNVGTAADTSITTHNQIVVNGDWNFGTGAVAADNRVITVLTGGGAVFDPTASPVLLATGDIMDYDVDAVTRFGITADYTDLEDGDLVLFIDSDQNATLDGVAKTYVELETAGAVELIDTWLVDFTVDTASTTEAQDLTALATVRSAADVLDQSTDGAAQALIDFPTATDELLIARGNLLSAESEEEAHDVAESLGPTVDEGAIAATTIFTNQTSDLTSTRLAALRQGSETGMAAGELAHGTSFWAQVFGTTGEQDERDGVDGFDVDSVGIAAGVDTQNLNDAVVLGLALAYANTNVDSDNANSSEVDIDNFQIALYGDYDVDSRTYISGQVGYIWGDNESTRHDVGGIAGLDAQGDYDSDQWLARVEAGRDFHVGGQTILTPKVLANYTHYSADDYTETGAGGANLNVDSESVNLFEVGVGVDASWQIKHSDGSWCEPVLSAGVRHDLIGDEVQTTNSFTGGGAAFETQGADPARTTGNLGAALTYHATTNWDLKAGYDFEFKSDYTSHSGVVRASYKF